MVIQVANPIYDAVFKYLMEDERIARTLLSALLKKEVVSVKSRRNEYSNTSHHDLTMFRIDFSAHVRQDDGTVKVVLIELQKTWLVSETCRFRNYLSTQYANPENIPKEDNPDGYALPMVAVYLLGHRLGIIDEPVVYIRHKAYDYDGNEVAKGIPNGFIESLNHDCIIVQIPLLHGQVNNRLEKVLSVFDQSTRDAHNEHVLNIDESRFTGDDDMMYIIHRLTSAASDAKMRRDMSVEDEFFSEIERRDEQAKRQAQVIREKDEAIKDMDHTMRLMVTKMESMGLTVKQIAEATGKPETYIRQLIGQH